MLARWWRGAPIRSNLLSGLVSAQLAVRPDRDGLAWRAVGLGALLGIAVTGIVYASVLAAIHEPAGAAESLVNAIVHYLVPAGMVIGWLVSGPRPRIAARTAGWAFAVLAGVFAAGDRWLPAAPRAARPGTAGLVAQ